MQSACETAPLNAVAEQQTASATSVHFAWPDANGNCCDLSATTGSIAAHYEYSPFGSVAASTGALKDANPWQFSTKYYDEETHFKYYGYRYLENGRWISRDPIGSEGGPNEYEYLDNSALIDIDPIGLSACKGSEYDFIVHGPMKDRDLWTAQTISVSTFYYVGPFWETIIRSKSFKKFYGLTVTEPSVVGGDCCCEDGGFKPIFELKVHSQIYLLHEDADAWDVDSVDTGDSAVDDYWYYAPGVWYRRHLAMKHERKHQKHGRKNYKKWAADLKAFEANRYKSKLDCLKAVGGELRQTWKEFNASQQKDTDALHDD